MSLIFLLSAIMSVFGAVMMAGRRSPIYGLLFLLLSFCGAAGVYYSLNATFIAVSQVLVYAGAIAVLFLFVLMFVDLRRKGEDVLPPRVNSFATYEPDQVKETEVAEPEKFRLSLGAAIVSLSVFIVVAYVIYNLPERFDAFTALKTVPEAEGGGHLGQVKEFGRAMINDFPMHFQVVGFVVLVGVMGAVVLGKRLADERGIAVEEPQEPDEPEEAHGHH